jgi:hypothetical protein
VTDGAIMASKISRPRTGRIRQTRCSSPHAEAARPEASFFVRFHFP